MKTIIKLIKWVVIFLIALSIWIAINSIDEDLTDEAKKHLAVEDIADAEMDELWDMIKVGIPIEIKP